MNHKDKIDITRKLHEILCGLSGKEIALVSSDPPGRTDTESYIALPIEDPEVDVIHRHEWTHILFKTRLHARARFVGTYLAQLRARGMNTGGQVQDLVELVCNALDDVRVVTLQDLVYPMSASRLRTRWRRMVSTSRGTNIVLRIIGLGIGMHQDELPKSDWERYDLEIYAACRMVYREGYAAVLLAARHLLDSVIDYASMNVDDEVEDPLTAAPTEPARRLSRPRRRRTGEFDTARATQLLEKLSLQAKSVASIQDTELSDNSVDRDPLTTEKMVQAALGAVEPEQLQQILHESKAEVQTIAAYLRQRLRQEDPDDSLVRNLGRVSLIDVAPGDVEEFPLSEEDQRVIDHLHQLFVRLRDIRDRRRTDEGSTLDPERYIDFMLGQGDQDFFLEDVVVRGFVLLILVDMSGSMLRLWTTVSRAAKVAACSTHFPFSHREFWAFSGAQSGETAVLRFLDPEKGYFPKRHVPEAWGLTPLHVAIEMGVRRLRQLDGRTRHLLVVTDGNPQQVGQAPTALRDSVAKTVRSAARSNVAVSAVIVGNEVTDEEATRMFGRRWKRVSDTQESLFYEMVDLVKTAFMLHLRR